jgi:hypothetical protein
LMNLFNNRINPHINFPTIPLAYISAAAHNPRHGKLGLERSDF